MNKAQPLFQLSSLPPDARSPLKRGIASRMIANQATTESCMRCSGFIIRERVSGLDFSGLSLDG